MATPMAFTPRIGELIRALALRFLTENPGGIRHTDLVALIMAHKPQLNPATVNATVSQLAMTMAAKVYKPVWGVYRLKEFSDEETDEVEEEPAKSWQQLVPGAFSVQDVIFAGQIDDAARPEEAIEAARAAGASFCDFEKEIVWHCYRNRNVTAPAMLQEHMRGK